MTKEEYTRSCMDVAYLAACAVNGEIPDGERVSGMNLANLYVSAERHSLTAIAAAALESAGVKDDAFSQAMGKAILKSATFDLERAAVLEQLEKAEIRYMLLKGAVLKSCYPKAWMRQMADHDILIDGDRAEEVREIMESLGFTTEYYDVSVHDIYHKPPVSNFEMHRALFGPTHEKRFVDYYADVRSRLAKDEGNACGYHFTPEDFYIYMTVHEYKHYSGGGVGLRSLLDTYVWLKKNGETLERDTVRTEMEKLGLTAFEEQNRTLAAHLFGGEELTEGDLEMLGYILDSGTYGTMRHSVENHIRRRGRIGYLFSRVFLPYRSMVSLYPILKRAPFLLPACWIARVIHALTTKREKVMYQLKAALLPVRR